VKKNLLAIAAVLSMLAAILCVWFAAIEGLVAYKVRTTGMFHGVVFSARSAIYAGVCSLWAGIALGFVALGCVRIRARIQRGGSIRRARFRSQGNDD
jgi:hypothetical protein